MPAPSPSPSPRDERLARAVGSRPPWPWSAACALLGLLAPSGLLAQSPPSVVDEYRVKAAFVFRFTQFVTWPHAAVAASPTVDVCIVRPSPFGAELEQMVQGETIGGRALRVREVLADSHTLVGCHALFVGGNAPVEPELMQAAAAQHILTVGESEAFLRAGGIIALRVIDRRVRFEIDADNARRAGLRIAAQLLNLAVHVRGGTP